MEIARQGAVRVVWNKKDVTTDVSQYLVEVNYLDHEEGFSDDVTIVFDNSTGVWSEDWYPEDGDTVELWMGYANKMMYCGIFEVDEITLEGMPDVIEVKMLASGISKALRTRNNKAFEDLTLKQIAQYFCKKHGFRLIDQSGQLSQINLDRKTQENKTDLSFLAELAQEYGFVFSVRGSSLIFTSYYELDNATSLKEIDKTQISRYRLKEKTYDTYATATFAKRNKKSNQVVNIYSDWNGKAKSDTLVVGGSASNAATAAAKVKGGLWNKNKFKQSGDIDMDGDPELVAGMNFDLTGFGAGSGKYHIVSSNHTVSGSGVYSTALTIRKTGTIPKPKRVPRVVKQAPSVDEEVGMQLGDGEEN